MSNTSHFLSRRQFIKAGTCGAMTIGPLVNTIAQLSLMNSASAQGTYDASQYKALVCIFLSGGCDANNIVIPQSGHASAEAYANDRGLLGLNNGVVNTQYNASGADETLSVSTTDQLGLHPALTNIATMFDDKELAFVTNVGTLAEPINKDNYSTKSRPQQLFSHSDQTTQWMSSIADQPFSSGWGARVADLYNDTWNPSSEISMLITAAGNSRFLNGGSVNQYTITTSGAIKLEQVGAVSSVPYTNTAKNSRLEALERIMQYSQAHIIEEGYSNVVTNAQANEERVNTAILAEAALNLDESFDTIFNNYGASGNIADELKSVLRMIAGRESLGNNNQIFFVDMGSFDHHANGNDQLNGMLNDLDKSVAAYNECLKVIESADPAFSYDQVTTFQASDFNRTFTPNSTGSDHGWGTHTFIFGGAVKGGQFYGNFPELGVDSIDSVPSDSRGRLIPTTSVDQYSAVIAKWFGASDLDTIFPNLYRFDDPFDSGITNLGFL